MNRRTIGMLLLLLVVACVVALGHDPSSPMAGYFLLLWSVTLAVFIPFFVRHVIQTHKRAHNK